jgi:hypothetical protein
MQRQPAGPANEFGRRQTRPAVRAAGSERVRVARVVPGVVGQNTREFLKPGATAYLGKATPQARRRMVAVLAVTGGVLYGAAVAPHAVGSVGDASRAVVSGADLSSSFVLPFVDHVAGVAERLQRDVMRGTASAAKAADATARTINAAIEAAPGVIADGVEEGFRLAGKVIVEGGVAVADNVIEPFVDHVVDVGTRMAEGIAVGSHATARAVAEAPGQISEGASRIGGQIGEGIAQIADAAARPVARGWGEARYAMDATGRVVRTGVEDWVETQVAEMKSSAGMIREGLSPAVGRLAELAVKTVDMISRDMEREAKLAEIDKTGVVIEIPGYKAYADLDGHAEQVRLTMAALVDGVEKKIMARTADPSPVSFEIAKALPQEVPAPSSLVGEREEFGALTKRAAYRIDGDQVTIGGSRIRSDVVSSIAHAARITGNDAVYLAALAGRESAFRERDKATTSSAEGLFQFIKETWLSAVKQFGSKLGLGGVSDEIKQGPRGGHVVANPARKAAILAMRKDPLVSGLVASEMERRDRTVLEQALGRPATAGERYMPHFLGIADAVRMVSLGRQNPSAPAADYFKKAAAANKSLFYAKNGAKYSVAQVIGGFKNWFEGPNGGMKRYAAFAQAAAHVPTPVSSQYAVVKQAAPQAQAAPAARPAVHVARPSEARPQVQTASLQTGTVEATPSVSVKPAEAEIRIDEASLPPPTIQVRNPIKPGKEASWKLGTGRIVGYIDASGKLGSWATSFGRSQIISGFGPNFARLPAKIQDHLKNAEQLDLDVLAPYAKLMPPAMREGFVKEGLTFQDAVPPSGGELVTVANPKYEIAKREAVAAAKVAAREAVHVAATAQAASMRAEVQSPSVQTASLVTDDEAAVNRNDAASVAAPAIPPIPSGLDRPLRPAEGIAAETIDWSPQREETRRESVLPGRRLTDNEVRLVAADLSGPRIAVRRRRAPQVREDNPGLTTIDLPKGLFGP